MSDDNTIDPTIDFGDEFGVVKFADSDDSGPAIAFGTNDTEQLPHWTQPPTGEIPRYMKSESEPPRRGAASADDVEDTTDVWTAYNEPVQDRSSGTRRLSTDSSGAARRFETTPAPPQEARRNSGRIVIGTDPTDERRRPASREEQVTRSNRPTSASQTTGSSRRTAATQGTERDLPMATAVGASLAAVFIGTLMYRPFVAMIFIVAMIGVASFEFFTQAHESRYRPPLVVGVAACVAAPTSAYWIGDAALPLVIAFGFIAAVVLFIGSSGTESGPVPNTAITMLAIIWIGLLSSYAALILRFSTLGAAYANIGTDTLFIVVFGVIANDTFAYFVGSSFGRTPLRDWISPAKSVEGLIGGTIGTFIAVIAVGMRSSTWNGLTDWVALAVVISVMAPLGDLAESMFKRNLEIKDFGTILRGHGGALDRFDSLLFTLPAVYYLTLVIQPWS